MVALRIALRYLFSKKSHNAVNAISIISVVGIALASLAIVCILSVFNGFTDLALRQASVLSPDLLIEPVAGKVMVGSDSLCGIVRGVRGVALAEPVVEERALAISGARQMPVRLKGVTERYGQMTDIDRVVKEDGTFLLHDSIAGDVAALGVGVALGLEARPSLLSRVELYVPRRIGRINPANPAASFQADTLLVGGVFQTEQAESDADLVIAGIDVVRRLLEYDDEATGIEVKVDGRDDGAVLSEIKSLLGSGYVVRDRVEQQEEAFRMIAVEKWVTFCMLAFILMIASFNVVSTLSMLVIEKDDDARTLFALGASSGVVTRIFMIEGWLISFLGGLLGVVVGAILCIAQEWFGFIRLGGDHEMMTTDVYPVRLDMLDLCAVLGLVAVVGCVVSSLTAVFAKSRFLRHVDFVA